MPLIVGIVVISTVVLFVRAEFASLVDPVLLDGWLAYMAACVVFQVGTLAASLVPTTLAGHRFWELEDPAQRTQQKLHFFKNVSMLGGLIIAAGDTDGKPGVAWRTRRVAKDARREAKRLAHDARRETKLARARIS